METTEFLQLLPVTIDRSMVTNQLRSQIGNMTDNVLPSFRASLDVFEPTYKFRSQLGKQVENAFARQRMTQNRTNWVGDVLQALENANDLLPTFVEDIGRVRSPLIARDGIDLRTANILQLAEMNKFMLSYAPKLLLWMYASEGAAMSAHVKDNMSTAERQWLTKNLTGFVAVVSLYCRPAAEIRKKLDGVAAIPVAGIDFETAAAVDYTKVDPLRMGFIGEDMLVALVSGISFRLGKLWAEWSVKNHNEQKELKNALELRLIEIKLAQDGTTDAALTKRIRYTEDRLSKLTYQIAQYEA